MTYDYKDEKIINTLNHPLLLEDDKLNMLLEDDELSTIAKKASVIRSLLEKEGLFDGDTDEAFIMLIADIVATYAGDPEHLRLGIKAVVATLISAIERAYTCKQCMELFQ